MRKDDRGFLISLAQVCAAALDRARLDEAERRARADAEAANLTKAKFLATMSHELRTPLNAIAGYTELLEMGLRGPVTTAQRQDLERIRRNQYRLLALVNDVLNFARIEAGRVEFTLEDVPLGEVIGELEPLVAPQMAHKG